MHWKRLVKGFAFVLIFVVLFLAFSKILTSPGDYRNYQWIAGFYEEPENSLDAVYISSSTCYAYWNSLLAWDSYGIAVYPYTCNAQHFITAEYLIREVRKTQPDALFIINTNTIDDEKMMVEEFHHLLDYMPLSTNKLELTNYLAETAGLTWEESLELYVPIYRYHDRWSELQPKDFMYWLDGMKGASAYEPYLQEAVDITDIYAQAEGQSPMADYISEAALSLMDYCEQENARVLFVTVPRAESELRIQQLNQLNAMLEERGFDTLNLLANTELLHLDLAQDFYNEGHTNVHGSVKFTQYLSEYLIENYGFADKHGNTLYTSWDAGYQKYAPTLQKYTLDLEMDLAYRTTKLEQPGELTAVTGEDAICLSWIASENADGYAVYRKQAGKAWEFLDTAEALQYTDEAAESGVVYHYTVVPFVEEQDGRYYGKFSYSGVSAKNE